MKSDGYLMPNEQIENPIKAFESHHIVDFGKQISDGMAYIGRNQVIYSANIRDCFFLGCYPPPPPHSSEYF